jgi:hypothetical protein
MARTPSLRLVGWNGLASLIGHDLKTADLKTLRPKAWAAEFGENAA